MTCQCHHQLISCVTITLLLCLVYYLAMSKQVHPQPQPPHKDPAHAPHSPTTPDAFVVSAGNVSSHGGAVYGSFLPG